MSALNAPDRGGRHESDAWVARILESIADGLVTLDSEWRYTYINDQAEYAFGRQRSELLGKCFWEEFPGILGTEVERELRRAVAEQVSTEYEAYGAPRGCWYNNRVFPTPDGGVAIYFRDVTDRKQTEDKLRQSETLLAEAQQLTHIGSWNWDIPSDTVIWSVEHYRICGLKPQEGPITFERGMSFVHPDDRAATREIVEQALRNRRPYECCLRLLRPDGTVRFAQSRGQALYDERGNPVRMFGTLQDVTERKRADEESRKNEERFRRSFELGLIGMAITSPSKGCLEVNDEICQILGYTRDELLKKTWAEMTHPDDLAADVANFNRVMAGEFDGYVLDKRWFRKDGQIIDSTISVKCVRSADGAVDYFVAMLQDVTSRMRAQRSLQESHAMLRAVIEGLPDAIYVKDRQGRFLLANSVTARIMGKTIEMVLGRDNTECFAPETARRLMEDDRRILETEQTETYDEIATVADVARAYLTTKAPFRGADGEVLGVLGISRDITERKRAEQALQESTDRLQALSRRLLEVQESERRHLARELHDEVGQTLTGLGMLLRFNDDSSADAVRRSCEQARHIVGELIEKVRALSFDLRPAELDQLGLLPALISLFERFTDQMGVRINFKHQGIETGLAPEVETAAYRIIQESLTNVARHAGVGEAMVRVRTTSDTLDLQIEDRGRGFDPEARLDAPRSIGLAGMRERVELLSGRLTIEAIPGRGTLITAELPVRETTPRDRFQAKNETNDDLNHSGG